MSFIKLNNRFLKINNKLIKRLIRYFLSTNVSGNGSISPASGIYDEGETIAVTATPDAEHELDYVDITDAGGLTQMSTEVFNWVIDSTTSMVAYFKIIYYNILVYIFNKTNDMLKNNFNTFGLYTTPSTFVSSVNWKLAYIQVNEGEIITYNVYTNKPANIITYFDENNIFVSNVAATLTSNGLETGSSIVPANAKIAVIGTFAGQVNNSFYTYSENEPLYYNVPTLKEITVNSSIPTDEGNLTFNTIAEALDFATLGTVVNVMPGTYNEVLLVVKDGVSLIGADKETTIINGELPETATTAEVDNTSTVDLFFSGLVKNLTITSKNMRYPIHSDGSTGFNKQQVENCKLIHYGNYELWNYRNINGSLTPNSKEEVFRAVSAFGGGTRSGDIKILKNCYLESNLRCFSMHNNLSFTYPSLTIVDGCEMVSHGLDYDNTALGFNIPFFVQNFNSGKEDIIIINNCTGGDYIGMMGELYHKVIVNGQQLKTIYNTAGAGKLMQDRIWEVNPIKYEVKQKNIDNLINNGSASILRGYPLKQNGNGVELMTDSDLASEFYGVAMQDISVGAYGDVFFNGYLIRKYFKGLEDIVLTDGDNIGINSSGIFVKNSGLIVCQATVNQNIIVRNIDNFQSDYSNTIFINYEDKLYFNQDVQNNGIYGGSDASEFEVDIDNKLKFKTIHDYDLPNDVNGDRVYNVKIKPI